MIDATLKVEVALAGGPLDDPTSLDWTDLSDRVRGASGATGRSDQLAKFTTGSAKIILDNSDGELDPQNLHGLVPAFARTVTDGVTTNTDATVTSATARFRAEDVGKAITGAGIPDGATIATFNSATSVELSVPATATASGVTVTVEGGRGLPFCPVRLTVDYDGDSWPWMGRAFLGPEGWPVARSPHGTEATVEVQLLDPTALFSWLDLDPSLWNMATIVLDPDWWIAGEQAVLTYAPSDLIPNEAAGGGDAEVTSGYWNSTPTIVPGDSGIALAGISGAEITSYEADLFPAGDIADATWAMVWATSRRGIEIGPTPVVQEICSASTSSGLLWKVYAEDFDLVFEVYDGAGTLLATHRIDGDLTSPKYWASGNPHMIVVRVKGGTEVRFWADTQSATEVGSVPTDAFASDWLIGPASSNGMFVDEAMFWRRALTESEITVLTGFVEAPNLYRGDSMADRLARWYAQTGYVLHPDEADEWYPPADSYAVAPFSYPALWGIGDAGSPVPETLGGALAQTAEAVGGDLYALRDGRVRVRTLVAVDDVAYAATYATPVANLTDEASPTGSPPAVRRGAVGWSGTRIDRVTNIAAVTWLIARTVDVPGGVAVAAPVVYTAIDAESKARFGRRTKELAIALYRGQSLAVDLAERLIDRFASPTLEAGAVTVQPLLDASGNAADFVFKDLELEVAVTLTDSPPASDPIVENFNVQGWSWKWSPADLSVSLNLAKT